MGLRSKLKKALGKVVQALPGSDKIQKVIGKDPIAQAVMKVDPLARDIGDVHGLRPQAGPAAAAPVAEGRKGFVPPTRGPNPLADRVAAMRARFGRPGAVTAMPAPVSAVPPTPAAPAAMNVTTKPVVVPPVNPVAQDVDAYSQAWGNGNNSY